MQRLFLQLPMQSPTITVVSGLPGIGKTTWIQQQLNSVAAVAIYLNLGSGNVAIDATYLTAEIPGLITVSDAELSNFLAHSFPTLAQEQESCTVYIELGFQIDLASLSLPAALSEYQRVAIVPPNRQQTEWHDWADLVIPGIKTSDTMPHSNLWRSPLSGQVLDPASLNTFWYELTQGAYGAVQRAKGIFDVADGRSLHFDFVAGAAPTRYTNLDVPLWFNGRPDRFSGIEIIGNALDQPAIAQTLKDCCLDDQIIAYYQRQIKDSLESGAAAA
jgi:Cobalamin synthesis protein cobW C-terminal domain